MDIVIRQADNGFILETVHDDLEDFHLNETLVVEQDRRDILINAGSPFTFQKLVWDLKELLGEYGSKHDEYRFCAVIKDQDGKEVEDE